MTGNLKTTLYIVLFLGSIVGGLMASGGKDGVVTTEVEGTMRCQPHELVGWLITPKARRKWVEGLTEYEDLDVYDMNEGTRTPMVILHDGDKLELTFEVVKVDDQKLVIVKETYANWVAESRFEFEGFGNQTRTHYSRKTSYNGFFRKLFAPITKHFVKEEQIRNFDRLKKSATFEFA